MGFFSKLWKGVKKVFKKIGRGVKKVFAKIGKFADKFGVVGQIGLMLIPWGTVFSSLFGGIGSSFMNAIANGMNHGNAFIRGASHLVNAAVGIGTTIYEGYKTVTGAVKSFIGNTVGYVGKNLNIPFLKDFGAEDALWRTSNKYFGREGVLGQVGKDIVKQWDVFKGSFGQIFKPPVIVDGKVTTVPGTDQNQIEVDDTDKMYASASDNIDYDTSNWKSEDWLDKVMDESRRSIGVGNNNTSNTSILSPDTVIKDAQSAYNTLAESFKETIQGLTPENPELSGWGKVKQQTVENVYGIPGTALATVGTQALLGDQTPDYMAQEEENENALRFASASYRFDPGPYMQNIAFGISPQNIAYADYMNAMLPFFQQGNSSGMYGTIVPQYA